MVIEPVASTYWRTKSWQVRGRSSQRGNTYVSPPVCERCLQAFHVPHLLALDIEVLLTETAEDDLAFRVGEPLRSGRVVGEEEECGERHNASGSALNLFPLAQAKLVKLLILPYSTHNEQPLPPLESALAVQLANDSSC